MTREQWKNRKTKQPSNHIWLKDEITDKELWSGAFNAVAGAIGCKEPSTACNWADRALRHWKEYEEKAVR